jgi:hypothetical protein
MITETIGNGTISVESDGKVWIADDRAYRQQYAYTITAEGWEYVGNDLHSGVGRAVDEAAAMRDLCGFLSACVESREYGDDENADLFPEHVGAWAEQYPDEIVMASLDHDEMGV